MVKSLKITLIAVFSAAIASTVLIAGFSGLPAKIRAKNEYSESLSNVAAEYPYADLETPADYVLWEKNGIRLMMPADLQPLDDSDPESYEACTFMNDSGSVFVFMEEPFDFGELDIATLDDKTSAEALDRFCRSMGREPMKDWYSFFDVMYHLSLDDCNIHSAKQAAVFEALANAKTEMIPAFEKCWDWQNADGDKGFIMLMKPEETDETASSKYCIQAELYASNSRNTSNAVMIRADDLELCCRIANSMQLTG